MFLIWHTLRFLAIFFLLTLVTQVGGLIYCLYKLFGLWIGKNPSRSWRGFAVRSGSFVSIYLLCSFLFVPFLAKKLGRVPLPVFTTEDVPLRPATWLTVLANRHYVKPELAELLSEAAKYMNNRRSGTELLYLDANFPFWNGFPLMPHLSHDDGEKVDLTFLYRDGGGEILNRAPTWLGYGLVEDPTANEYDMPAVCREKGYWQYSILKKLVLFPSRKHHFDTGGNQLLIKFLATHRLTGKLFIEPHLKSRLALANYQKIRFAGCHAVRHDDHIHVQL